MFSKEVLKKVSEYFPEIKILTKENSVLMKILAKLLFFTPGFMTSVTTVVGNNIYFPSQDWLKKSPVSALVCLMHEFVHVNDIKKYGRLLFSFLYLLPITLIPLFALFFLFSWKLALPLVLLCLLPLPSYFRMVFEKRAYFASLYVQYRLNVKKDYNINLEHQKDFFVEQFLKSNYYFMWPFKSIEKDFDEALKKIMAGERPYQNETFDIIDDILDVV